jgi:hypothetical protein
VAYLQLASLTRQYHCDKRRSQKDVTPFDNNTGGQFAAVVVDINGIELNCEYLCEFLKTFEMAPVV